MVDSYTVLAGTIGTGIWASRDGGERWSRPSGIWNESQVFAITPHPTDAAVVFAGVNDGVYRSEDAGRSFQRIEPNTPIWTFALNAADPELVLTCSHYGQVFESRDGGDSWRKIRREFSEIRALAWLPN